MARRSHATQVRLDEISQEVSEWADYIENGATSDDDYKRAHAALKGLKAEREALKE